MAARLSSSLSRSLLSTARTSSLRPPSLLRPPPNSSLGLRSRRFSFTPSRTFGELGCTQSFLPLNATTPLITAHLCTEVRAFSELYHGTFCRTCQDR